MSAAPRARGGAPTTHARDRGATPRRNLLVFALGTLLAVAGGLIAFSVVFQPPGSTFAAMAAYLGITATISLVAGALAYRLGWMRRSPRLAWTLLAGYLLAAALTFVNVLTTARLMFISQHDLLLSSVLLVFSAVIAVSIGYLVSSTVVAAVRTLNHGADEVARGNLDVVLPEEGPEELAALARRFNAMTARLKLAESERATFEQARRDLITAVGHDLRTPIASVRVITEALADGMVEDPATVQRYLGTASRDLDALSRLVDDLFVLAQLDSGGVQLELRPNSLADMVSDTLESFSARAEQQRVKLRGEALAGLPSLEFDASYVGRVLTNLVDNALRYTPPGGEIVLTTSAVDDGVEVQVCDSGPGIDERDLPLVFDRFYRGEASRSRALGGSGLGLAIVKGIVEAHGGRVGVRVAPGAGTTFSFVLPT